jgi:small-conductance mechanosensitive channel
VLGWLNPWVLLGVLLALLGTAGAAYVKGRRDADRSAEIAIQAATIHSLQAALQEQRRQAAANQLIADAASAREEAMRALADDMQAEIDDYVRRLEQARAPAECALDQSDVDRLRHLATGRRASTPSTRPAQPATQPRPRAEPSGGGGS